MARSRNIKPGFFINLELAEVEPIARLLFIGLWTIADREGRLADQPRRIKAQILPYDDVDVDAALNELQSNGFVIRYEAENKQYIQVVNFHKHQNPHIKEAASTIPAPEQHNASTRPAPDKHGTSPADSLNPLTDSFNPQAEGPPPGQDPDLPDDDSQCPAAAADGIENDIPKNRARDYSDWKPPQRIIERVMRECPGMEEPEVMALLPEFITYAENHYKPGQLAARFLASAIRSWEMQQRAPAAGREKENGAGRQALWKMSHDQVMRHVKENDLPEARPGEEWRDYIQRLVQCEARP